MAAIEMLFYKHKDAQDTLHLFNWLQFASIASLLMLSLEFESIELCCPLKL